MIVGAEVYCASQQAAMNCSIQQYETMHFQSHWPLSHQPLHSVIKKEPTEENEFFKGDKTMYTGPLTPPGLSYSAGAEYQSGPTDYQRSQEYQRSEYQAYQKPAEFAAASPAQPDFQRSSPNDFNRPQSAQEYRKEQRASPTFQELHQGQAFEKSTTEYQRNSPEARPPVEYQRASPAVPLQQTELQRASPGVRPAELQASPGVSPRASPPLASLMPAVTLTEGLTPPGSSPDQPPPKEEDSGDSLGRLQMALQRHGLMYEEKLQCPMCEFSCSVRSTFNEHLLLHETKCTICEYNGETKEKLREHMKAAHDTVLPEEDSWGEDEPGLTTPKVNSQGKVKTFRCKQCDFCAVTKAGFWEHSKVHIKRDRILTCPKCPFITEYKHHLEYHLRNHFGSKPFKCDKCSYTCVNKSMLNSHLKSHSNVYQFRCADCTYATKYCHSLKLHLRKYGHSPAMVLNSDGSPNPLPIVDVYGTRRGPKQKKEAQPSVPLFNPYGFLPQQLPYYGLLNAFQPFPFTPEEKNNNQVKAEEDREEKSPLDLTCPEPTDPTPEMSAESPEQPKGNRRKGKAYKIDKIALRLQQQEPQEAKRARQEAPSPVKACEADSDQGHKDEYDCSYCDISFKDIVMYTMHMGYHGYQDPFQCNMCGQQTADKVAFFLHIARTSHS